MFNQHLTQNRGIHSALKSAALFDWDSFHINLLFISIAWVEIVGNCVIFFKTKKKREEKEQETQLILLRRERTSAFMKECRKHLN